MSVIDRQTKRQIDRPGYELIRKYAQEIISQSSHFSNFSVEHPPRPSRIAYFACY